MSRYDIARKSRQAGRGIAVFSIALCLVGRVHAQTSPPSKDVTVIANTRLRMEYWNWFDSPSINDSYAYFGGFARLGLRQDRDSWSWLVEGAAPILLGLPDDAVAPPPQGAAGLGANYRLASGSQKTSFFLKQGTLTFKLHETPAVSLRLGRFEFSDGNENPQPSGVLAALRRERIAERLLGPFGFSHIGRSFDGVDLRATTQHTGVTLLAARTTQGVFNVHGMRDLAVGVVYGALTRLDSSGTMHSDARLFALGYRDARALPKADNRPAADRLRDSSAVQLLTLGANLVGLKKLGDVQVDVLLWGALQAGDWGVQDHGAFGYAAEAGLQWKLAGVDPWVRLGYWRGSGDDDPLDSEHATFFQVLPTPRVYARFPFYNLMNSKDVFAELVLRPTADWTIRSDFHVLSLTNASDAWYSGGGAFEVESFGYTARPGRGRALARVIDASIDYRASQQLSFGAYIARATPDRAIERIYPGTGAGLLGFIEARWRR